MHMNRSKTSQTGSNIKKTGPYGTGPVRNIRSSKPKTVTNAYLYIHFLENFKK